MDPRDQSGNIIYDRGVNLLETWRAMKISLIGVSAELLDYPTLFLKIAPS
jgi:aldehyde reductase